ncbi:MAG: hypothetical protein GWN93_26975 [Deltaproteobacteria bacterium]|nr:hypothetical protein [Deltaproteobacteria bacterium]
MTIKLQDQETKEIIVQMVESLEQATKLAERLAQVLIIGQEEVQND